MADPAQLDRIAAVVGTGPAGSQLVQIYHLDNGRDWWGWYCADCLAKRLADGWALKEQKPAPHDLKCDDCHRRACSNCREKLPRDGQRYCNECHAAYMRENRPTYGGLTDEQRRKAHVRSYTNTLIKRGKLTRQPCTRCGSEKSEAHHPDYSKPREIVWLCRMCHVEHHQQEERNKRVSQEEASA